MLVFGLVVASATTVSVVLAVLQATAVGSWCGLCRISAVIALLVAALARAEVLTAVGAVRRARRPGRRLLRALNHGEPDQ